MIPINSFQQFNGPQRIESSETTAWMLFQFQVSMLQSIPLTTQLTRFDWELLGMKVRNDAYTNWLNAFIERI